MPSAACSVRAFCRRQNLDGRGELISSRQMEGNGTPGTARPPLGHAGYESDYPVRRTVLTGILSSVAYGHC